MAANDTEETMVLRTVYLPQELDSKLRKEAYRHNRSKNEIIREAVRKYFSAVQAAQSAASANGKDGNGKNGNGTNGTHASKRGG